MILEIGLRLAWLIDMAKSIFFKLLQPQALWSVMCLLMGISIDVRAKEIYLDSSDSPCLIALQPRGKKSETLYCFVEKVKTCEITGYRYKRDTFVRIEGLSQEVQGSCLKGGIKSLLGRPVQGYRNMADFLNAKSTLVFSGDESLSRLIFPTDGLKSLVEEEIVVAEPAPMSEEEEAGLVYDAPVEPEEVLEDTKVRIFFATDRKFNPAANWVGDRFGEERSEEAELNLGTAEVVIPKGHQKGKLEGPSVFTFKAGNGWVSLKSVEKKDSKQFYSELQKKVASSPRRDAFVFVHGFTTSFEDAARRTAQMAFDLNFSGAPILYSWPSGNQLWQYSVAENNAEWTMRHLRKFLLSVARNSGAERIHLIAHSMGNRPLINALDSLYQQEEARLFQQVILAAPDIDADIFAQVQAAVVGVASRVTVYASEHDKALKVSEKFHSARRLGQRGPNLFLSKLADTVEASKVDTTQLGHLYYGDNPLVLQDLALLIFQDSPPPRATLIQRQRDKLTFWELRPEVQSR